MPIKAYQEGLSIFLIVRMCKKIMVAGANAGIHANGNATKFNTPIPPLILASAVRMIAFINTLIISSKPTILKHHKNTN